MDAILEKAEVQEEEEAPQSEANKELLGAFKCTNIALEEEEEEEEEREREREKEKERAKKKAKQEELGWDAIIPEKHRASAPKPVRTIEGLEIYSDNEENLYVPIAARTLHASSCRPWRMRWRGSLRGRSSSSSI